MPHEKKEPSFISLAIVCMQEEGGTATEARNNGSSLFSMFTARSKAEKRSQLCDLLLFGSSVNWHFFFLLRSIELHNNG
jgi:hypothetical protein